MRFFRSCLTAWLLTLPSSAFCDTDMGMSYNLLLKFNVTDDWFLVSRSNLATRNDNDELFLAYTGASLGTQLTDTWSLRFGYRHARIKLGGRWQAENRPFVEAFGSRQYEGWRISNRARIEFRYFDERDDDIRLRNEIAAEAPLQLTALALRPFVEEEIFYGTRAGRVEANWLTLGLAWRPAKGTKLKAGYRRNRFKVGDDWRDRDVIVLGANLFF